MFAFREQKTEEKKTKIDEDEIADFFGEISEDEDEKDGDEDFFNEVSADEGDNAYFSRFADTGFRKFAQEHQPLQRITTNYASFDIDDDDESTDKSKKFFFRPPLCRITAKAKRQEERCQSRH